MCRAYPTNTNIVYVRVCKRADPQRQGWFVAASDLSPERRAQYADRYGTRCLPRHITTSKASPNKPALPKRVRQRKPAAAPAPTTEYARTDAPTGLTFMDDGEE